MSDVIVIASWLEEEHVQRIREAAPWAEVVHEPSLLPPPRYAADHSGHAIERGPDDVLVENKALTILARDIFDFVVSLNHHTPSSRNVRVSNSFLPPDVRPCRKIRALKIF